MQLATIRSCYLCERLCCAFLHIREPMYESSKGIVNYYNEFCDLLFLSNAQPLRSLTLSRTNHLDLCKRFLFNWFYLHEVRCFVFIKWLWNKSTMYQSHLLYFSNVDENHCRLLRFEQRAPDKLTIIFQSSRVINILLKIYI